VEDRDFYLRLLACGGLAFVDVPVAQYRIHGHNASISRSGSDGLNPLQQRIAADVQNSETINLHHFHGLNKVLLLLRIKHAQFLHPRRPLRYRLTRKLISLLRAMNRAGLLGW
jgi:hypothetical protein